MENKVCNTLSLPGYGPVWDLMFAEMRLRLWIAYHNQEHCEIKAPGFTGDNHARIGLIFVQYDYILVLTGACLARPAESLLLVGSGLPCDV